MIKTNSFSGRLLLLSCIMSFCLAKNAISEYQNPVLQNAGQDPSIFFYKGTYYNYVHSALYTSTDLVNWKKESGSIFAEGTAGKNAIWTQGMAFQYRGEIYYIYQYTNTPGWMGGEYIGLAKSSSPLGPFVDVRSPLFDFPARISDPCLYLDLSSSEPNFPDGKPYLYFTSVDANAHYAIYGVLLPSDLLPPNQTINPTLLLTQTLPFENIDGRQIVEGPEVFKRGQIYYLAYSANGFGSPDYCVSCATSPNPLGPFTKSGSPFLTKNITEGVYATGHNCFAYSNDGSQLYIVYHAQIYDDLLYPATWLMRNMRIDRLSFDSSVYPPRLYMPDGATGVTMPSPPSLFGAGSDSFTKTTLDRGIWHVVNEDAAKWSLSLNPGYLTIKSQNDTLYNERNEFKNLFLQETPPGDFVVSTKFDMTAQYNYEQAGLVLWQNMDNYYKFSRGYWNGEKINVDKEINGCQSNIYQSTTYPYPGNASLYLKTVVMDDEIFSLNSPDGINYSLVPQTVKMDFDTRRLGLIVTRDHSPVEKSVEFDYLRYHKNRVIERFCAAAGPTTDGYSWFSLNDYLDSTYWEGPDTPEGNWVAVDLSKPQTVSLVCIKWGDNHSNSISVNGGWGDWPENLFYAESAQPTGGNTVVPLSPPILTRWIFIWFEPGSSRPVGSGKFSVRSIGVYGEETETAPFITIDFPTVGAVLNKGQSYDITWRSVGAGSSVRLEASLDGGYSFTTMISSAPNVEGLNTLSFTIPDINSSNAFLRIRSNENPTIMDTIGPFTLGSP